jgi:hypothetical protein
MDQKCKYKPIALHMLVDVRPCNSAWFRFRNSLMQTMVDYWQQLTLAWSCRAIT